MRQEGASLGSVFAGKGVNDLSRGESDRGREGLGGRRWES